MLNFKPITNPSLYHNNITSGRSACHTRVPRRSHNKKVLVYQNSQGTFRISLNFSKFLASVNTKSFSRFLKINLLLILRSPTQITPQSKVKTTQSKILEGTQSTQHSSKQMTTAKHLQTKANQDSLQYQKVNNFRRLTTKTTICLNKRDNSNSSCNQLAWHMSGLR